MVVVMRGSTLESITDETKIAHFLGNAMKMATTGFTMLLKGW